MVGAGLGDEAFTDGVLLVRRGEHPANDIPAEDVENHVEIEVRFVVVPAEERLPEGAAIFDRSESLRKLRTLFDCEA